MSSIPLIRQEKSRRADISRGNEWVASQESGEQAHQARLGVICAQRVRRESAKKGQSVFLGGREAGRPALSFWWVDQREQGHHRIVFIS